MKGYRRWIAGLIVFAGMATPSVANAADCTLTGSGLETSATDMSRFQPATGTLKASMIFVDFSDHAFDPAEDPPDYPGNFPNPPGIGHDIVDWAADYLNEVSGGRTSLNVKMDSSWLRMPHPASHYTFTTFAGQREFMADAVALAQAEPGPPGGFDFSGRQILYVVSAPTSTTVLPNSPAFIASTGDAIVADGTQIRWGASFGNDARRATPDYGSHILAHETSHTFGLPDLYSFGLDFDHAHVNVGSWDRMGWIGPSFGYTGWHLLKLGWLDASQAICVNGTGDVTATLSPLASAGGTKMLISKTSASTAYVVENRASTGVDTGICNEGVLIYKVNANAATGGAPGAGPIDVQLSDPSNPGDASLYETCGAITNAPFGVGQTFSQGGVSVQVLSGTPSSGFSVRMTGPVDPATPTGPTGPTGPTPPTGPTGPTGPSAAAQTGGIASKLHLDGKRRVIADLTCPAEASSCTGTLTLALADGTKLATGDYSVTSPGGDVTLTLSRKARKALRHAFGKKGKAKATATLDGAGGKVTDKVKLLK